MTVTPGPPCTVCQHPARDEIDAALVGGESNRSVGRRFSIAETTIRRHRVHIAETLTHAREIAAAARAEPLADQIGDLLRRGFGILDRAETRGTITEQCAAIRELRGVFSLLAKVSGQIDSRPVVNVIQSPEYVRVQTAILMALEPFPDARQAVADALAEVPV